MERGKEPVVPDPRNPTHHPSWLESTFFLLLSFKSQPVYFGDVYKHVPNETGTRFKGDVGRTVIFFDRNV